MASVVDVGVVVDVVVVTLLFAALFSGWRQGAFSAALSAVGIVAGLVVGLGVSGALVVLTDIRAVRILIMLVTVTLLIGLGNMVGAAIGGSVRDRMRSRASQRWDSVVGSLLQVVIVAVVLWLLSIPVAANLSGQVGAGMRESRVLTAIDRAMPEWGKKLPERFAALIDVTGLPPLVSPFQGPSSGGPIAPPEPTSVDAGVVDAVRPGVVHVVGDADSCDRRLSGTGFVAAEDYVITNAHVVAGTNTVQVDTVVGVKDAAVVLYDPETDLAVLHSPGLGLDPLATASKPAESGDPAVVLGFPGSGPFDASAARVRDRINISGPDIYATGRTQREAYTLRGDIRQGNSGGPLITPEGEVLGVVFGTSIDGSDTGYALTLKQVREVTGDITRLTEPVNTQRCV